jgi:hypothetical protein
VGQFLAWLSREVPLREAAGQPLTELDAQAQQLVRQQQQRVYRAEFCDHLRLFEQCGDVPLPFERGQQQAHRP